ncbi:MAG: peptidoglycan-binding protein, partial [Myxococcales bacterium]|nr:peptidoglycan-binding protein [Myxococcales bacterium]
AAGRECPIFTDGALATVYRVSGGVPRLINLLCERALLAAYADNARQVNRALVRVVAKEVWPPRRPRTRRALRRASWAALAVVITALGFAAGLHLGTTTETGEARASAGRGATPPAVASAPPRVSAPPSPAMPPTTAEPSATTDDTSAAGDRRVLDDLLPLNTSDRANAAALTAALDAWRMPAAQVAPFEVDALPDALAAHDLRMLRVPESDFDALQRLDLPAIVWLSAAASEPRAVLVRRIERDTAFLRGVLPGETVRIHLDELLERWTGDAIVPWRDYAGLPDLVAFGDSGPHVTWLQEVLTRTGYFVGLPRGGFDEGTRMAVRAFQLASEIPADGQVGPLTKIRIYQTLGEHAAPALLADSDPSG